MIFSMCICLLVVAILVLHSQAFETQCPCSDKRYFDIAQYGPVQNLSSSVWNFCLKLDSNSVHKESLVSVRSINTRIRYLINEKTFNSDRSMCNVFLELIAGTRPLSSKLCPELCSPIPSLVIYDNDFVNFDSDQPISCTFTKRMFLHSLSESQKFSAVNRSPNYEHLLIEHLSWRLIMECFENYHWENYYAQHRWLSTDLGSAKKPYHTIHPPSFHVNQTPIVIPKRSIHGLVIWIGSEAGRELTVAQFLVLQKLSVVHPKEVVVGWAASDWTYSCRPGYTMCEGPRLRYRYLPRPAMNFMKEGWRCAQRRPLRALAHTLSLLDPSYLILLDDDTFFNFPLFQTQLEPIILHSQSQIPQIWGEFQGKEGPQGHLTTRGFYAGGSGYILNRKAIESLLSYEMKYFGFERESVTSAATIFSHSSSFPGSDYLERMKFIWNRKFFVDWKDRHDYGDEIRSNDQIHHLALLPEMLDQLASCHQTVKPWNSFRIHEPHHSTNISVEEEICVILQPHPRRYEEENDRFEEFRRYYSTIGQSSQVSATAGLKKNEEMFVTTARRLVDLCSNVMASENTCLHSDHSISRCLIYGANAIANSVICHSFVDNPPKNITFGMCFMAKSCDLHRHITCHRYRPRRNENGDLGVVLTTKNHKPFTVYSSAYDGIKTDTYI